MVGNGNFKIKRTRHGETNTKLHRVWESMIARCKYPTCIQYKDYGGRGITVCNEWLKYTVFRDFALTHGYQEGLQINRIDNDGNYEPSNVNFVTPQDNSNNRRTSIYVEWRGLRLTISQWAERLGINDQTIRNRYSLGKRGDELFQSPCKYKSAIIEWDGQSLTLSQWSEKLNISYRTLCSRYRQGKSGAELLAPTRQYKRSIA